MSSDADQPLQKGENVSSPAGAHGRLWNKDLAAVPMDRRTWGTYNYAALWTTLSVNVATYLVASSMIAAGMSWKQAIFTILVGHLIVLVPILLNAHAGAKFGIPFPVYARASFGVLGSNIPALLRGLVACGWFGIQSWIGGQAVNGMIVALFPSWQDVPAGPMLGFLAFWSLNLFVVLRGIETIRFLQGVSAPILMVISLALLGWAHVKAGGFGPMLSIPSKFQTFGEFFPFFALALTGVVAHWAAIALNISDFTRYAKSQRQQFVGQMVSLPITMTVYSFIGIAVTSATIIIFGEAIWDPVIVISRLGHPVAVFVASGALILATLNVNVTANVVSPANDFSNLWPSRISFKRGAIIACVLGLAIQPWKLLATYGNFLKGWLVGYSSVLGPIAGVLIADYFVIRKTNLVLNDLYKRGGVYEYTRGVNVRAVIAFVSGVAAALSGLAFRPFAAEGYSPALRALASFLYGAFNYAWFVGFGVSFIVYLVLMRSRRPTAAP